MFVEIRALKTKRAEGVAKHIMYFWCSNDNGRAFVNQIINNLKCILWDNLKILHGKPRHSQSQGSVERANQLIYKIF